MNSRKALWYTGIMIIIPFVISLAIYTIFLDRGEAIYVSFLGSLVLNAQLFFLGFLVEGFHYLRGKFKDKTKVFWLEWVETTFALWIIGCVLIGIVQSIKFLR
ncbi:MAG: hypothetical protein AAGA77_03670 [Bacteroidota bacterium]